MPVWLSQFLLSVALQYLVKSGMLTDIEAAAVKGGDKVLKAIDGIKSYSQPSDFPSGKNGQ